MSHISRFRTVPVLIIIALTAVCISLAGCAGGDTATVTINTGIHQQATTSKLTLFDRFTAFFPFIQKVYAEPWDGYGLDITISGAGMDSFTRVVPSETGILTLEVPSGPARTFTAVAYSDEHRAYGGIVTTDLAPGASVTIPIQMGELAGTPNISSIFHPFETEYAEVTINTTDGTSYRVYRTAGFSITPSDWGHYYPIGTTTTSTFNDMNVIVWRYYHYKVSALNEYGESDLGGTSTGTDYYEYYHC